MPTSVGPNTFGEENLVFGYDLGDTSNSYKGEPVTNLQTVDEGNVYQSMGGTGTTRELVDFVTPFGNKAWKVTIPANGTNGYSNTRAQGPTIQINRDGTYYYHGAWVWMSDDDYVLWEQGNTYVYKYSTGSNGMSSWSLRSALNRKDRAGRIWKAWGAWTARTEGGTGNQYHTFYKNGTLTRDLVFYIVAPMWGVGKARPVFFANGTRSATQGLIDLTGNSTIDLSNVSFDSNAQMTFDGTDDKAVVANFPHIWDGSVTMEAVVAWNDDSRSIIFGNYNVGANDINFEKLTGRALRFYWNRGERDVTTSSNVVTTTGNPHHVVMIRDKGSNSFKFYVDGEEIATSSNVGTDVSSTGSTFRIGGDTRDGTTIHNGDIPMLKIYNRALTASEIKANYNAIKGRFNI